MGFFSDDSKQAQANKQFADAPNHESSISHELIAAAAAYEAAKSYERYKESSGKPESHAQAKEWLAAITGGIVDKLVETKGLDAIDREKVRLEAHKQASEAIKQDF